MKTIVLGEAFQELAEAIAYYEGREPGLGRKLKEEVDRHVHWIIGNPDVPRTRAGGYRRVNLKVFPYYIAYLVHENQLWILAIANGRKKPMYWIDRKKKVF
ncbi:MAG: type II toxin-antitoxin system RelE/ParE family toxin [Desulfococcaceae bacterium]